MKLVTAVLSPHRVAAVRAALGTFGVQGMTISEVLGYGLEMWRTQTYRGTAFHDESRSNIKVEVIVADVDADDVVNVILASAGTTTSGAGKIWIQPVDLLERVRTAERGLDAL
jgi:nitrogen regulatory protein P-II 1